MKMDAEQKAVYRGFLEGLRVRQGDGDGLANTLSRLHEFSLRVVPPVLFRYRKPDEHSFSDLERGEVTFSSPVAFQSGDPDDAKMMLDTSGLVATMNQFSDPSIAAERMRSIDFRVAADVCDRCGRPFPDEAAERVSGLSPEDFAARFQEAGKAALAVANDSVIPELEKGREFLRVLCLTDDRANERMWDEYAEKHTGFVLAYRTDDLRMCDVANRGAAGILPILYDEAPFDDEKTLQWGMLRYMGLDVATDDELASIRAAYRKAVKYEYEQEWRACIFRKETEVDELHVQRPCMPASITMGRFASEETLLRCQAAADRLEIPLKREG